MISDAERTIGLVSPSAYPRPETKAPLVRWMRVSDAGSARPRNTDLPALAKSATLSLAFRNSGGEAKSLEDSI